MTSALNAAASSDSVLSTVQLTKNYGGAVALAPIDINIAAGERITLIGHNGSGKTPQHSSAVIRAVRSRPVPHCRTCQMNQCSTTT